MKKLISITLAVLFLMCCTVTIFANHKEAMPSYICISGMKYGFDINTETGRSTVDSSFTIYNGYYGEINATIQRKNGSNWEEVKTFTIKQHADSIELYKHWMVKSNNIYRCEFVFNVYNSKDVLLESVTKCSPLVVFPSL